ncbi:hypothetical protein AZH11_12700 [Pseudomonas simiae]|nr:hypothetical protein AZH11_12700 [Pseudomonas simiae]
MSKIRTNNDLKPRGLKHFNYGDSIAIGLDARQIPFKIRLKLTHDPRLNCDAEIFRGLPQIHGNREQVLRITDPRSSTLLDPQFEDFSVGMRSIANFQ